MSLLHKWQKLALFMYRATAKPLQERNDFVTAGKKSDLRNRLIRVCGCHVCIPWKGTV
jgi:hypothetical protein